MSMSPVLPNSVPSSSGSLRARGRVNMCSQVIGLGDHELKQFTLQIMETPLDGVSGMLGLLVVFGGNHHYILVGFEPGKFIKAEKGGESRSEGAEAGIHLSLVESAELEHGRPGSVRYEVSINLGTGKVKWAMAKVLEILASPNPNYDVFDDNCWAYTFHIAVAILKWPLDNAVDENVRVQLEGELEKIKHLERPQPKAALGALLSPKHPKCVQAAALFQQKLTHSLEHLPDDARVRRTVLSALHKRVSQ